MGEPWQRNPSKKSTLREARRGGREDPQEAPGSYPVICERAAGSDIPEVDRKKYLVPSELTVAQFQYVVRKRLRLPAEQAMFLFFDGGLPSANSVPLTQLYNDHKDQDGFLYVTYSGENTFGTTL